MACGAYSHFFGKFLVGRSNRLLFHGHEKDAQKKIKKVRDRIFLSELLLSVSNIIIKSPSSKT